MTIEKVRIRFAASATLIALAIIVISGVLTFTRADQELRNELRQQALTVASAVETELVFALAGDESDLGRREYQRLKQQIDSLRDSNPSYRYIYLLGRAADGRVFFFVDTEDPDLEDDIPLPPGYIYEEASPEMVSVFDGAPPVVEGPLADQWGTWVSALVPIMDPQNEKIVAVLGIDVDAMRWRRMIFRESLASVLHTASYILAALLLYMLWRSRRFILAQNIELAQRQERIDLAMKAGKLSFWDWDLRTDQIYFSPEFFAILGYEEDELPMRLDTWTDLLHPDERDRILPKANECVARGEQWDVEMRLRCRDGGYKWVSNHIESYVAGREAAPSRAFAIIVDIDEIRKSEERIHNLSTMVEQSTTSIIEVDVDRKIIYMNKAAEELSGYSFDEMEGRPIELLVAKESLAGESDFSWITDNLIHGRSVSRDIANIRKDGERYITHAHISAMHDRFGEITGYVSFEVDVTEQRLQQEELENFFKVNLDLLCIADTEGHFIKLNSAWSDILGYDVDELENRTFLDFVHPDDMQKTIDAMAQLERGEKVMNFINRYRKKGGEYRYIEWRSHAVGTNRIYAAARDLTDHILMSKRMQEQEQKYRGIIENMINVYYRLDAKGDIVLASPSAIALLGYESLEEIYGLRFREEVALKRQRCSVFELLVHSKRKLQNFEMELKRKDGTVIHAEMSGSYYVDEHEQIAGIEGIISDVTEKKFAQRNLEQSEANFRSFFHSVNDPIFILDSDWRIKEVNNTVVDPLGYSAAELIDRPVSELFESDDPNALAQHFSESPANSSEPFYGTIRTNDSRLIQVETNLSEGRWSGSDAIYCINKDISRIKASEDKFAIIFKFSPIMKTLTDLKTGLLVEVNNAFCEVFGYESSEAVGRDGTELVGTDQEFNDMVVDEIAKGHSVRNVETVMFSKAGEPISVLLSTEPIEVQGKSFILTAGIDITDRKQAATMLANSEAKLRSYIENAPYGILLSDMQGSFIDANPAACQMTGYSKEDMLHLCIPDITAKDDLQNGLDHFAKVIEQGSHSEELICVRKDGSRRNWLISAVLINDEKAISFVEDVTERKIMSEQLNQMQKMESIGRLAGGIAHDFNNMLYVILGNAEMMADELPEDEVLKGYLEEIRNAAQRSATLTRQLLGFARKQTVVPKVLDVNSEISTMLNMIKSLAGENIELKWSPLDSVKKIRIDPSQLDQILTNLIVNARDAIGSKNGIIEIRTENFECDEKSCRTHPDCTPGSFVLISVKDNGGGIAQEYIGNIFEPFYTTKKQGEGIGLGLSTVHGILKQNRGFITVESSLKEGTEFQVYLPTHADESTVVDKDHAHESSSKSNRATVLLVEDEASVLEMAKRILEKQGYRVLSTTSSQEAIGIARECKGAIDILLTDYSMPEMNGKELALIISQERPTIKVLFMSGFAAEDIIADDSSTENEWCIEKPFTSKDLAEKLKTMINRR